MNILSTPRFIFPGSSPETLADPTEAPIVEPILGTICVRMATLVGGVINLMLAVNATTHAVKKETPMSLCNIIWNGANNFYSPS